MGPVAPIISVVSGLFGIFSGIKSYKDSKDAAKEQKKLAALNAANIAAEGTESKRRAALDELERRGTSTAQQAASGLTSVGTMADWEKAQQAEFQKQMRWLQQSTSGRAAAESRRGSIAAAQTRAAGQGSLFSGLSGNVENIYGGGKGLGWWN